MWRHHGDQEPRRWFAEQEVIGSAKPQFLGRLFGLDELGFALAVALFFVVETVSSPYIRTIG